MQISHILLPIDGSIHSDHAIEHAVYLAKLTNARITVVNCYEWAGLELELSVVTVDELKKKSEDQSSELIEETSRILDKAGISYEIKRIAGSPGKVISNLAESKEYDLIIMGSLGHSNIAGLFLGSVTHKVLNTIYCPVMVVP